MKHRRPINGRWVWVSLLSALTVLAFWYLESQNTSPGEIAAAHARQPSLHESSSCSACHGAGPRGMTDACLACHVEIAGQLSARTGLHGLMSADVAEDCAKCHSEHHGREFRMINEQSFALAGIPDPKNFHHAGLDFGLRGIHVTLACEQCHRFAGAEVVPAGQKRFLGLDQRCASCHRDVHEGSCGQECAACHGQSRPFNTAATFEHTSAFPLDGGHGGLACVDCHKPGTRWAVDALLAVRRQPGGGHAAVRTCRACHLSPHRESLLIAIARVTNCLPEQSCDRCHRTTDKSFVGNAVSMPVVRHAVTGFPLLPPHEGVSCDACHEGFGERKGSAEHFLRAYPGRSADDCGVCHGDPHAGQFEHGPFPGGNCLVCHDDHAFRPSAFTIEQHGRTRFPLTGAHAAVGCGNCHPLSEDRVGADGRTSLMRVFHGTPSACGSCHVDVHAGLFDRPGLPVAVNGREGCARCHRTERFDWLWQGSFDHRTWAGYELVGAHARAECRDCHERSDVGESRVRSIGAVTDTHCQACHQDPHVGQFGPTPQVDCSRCHLVGESFGDLAFDHQRDSRFPLDDQHAGLACSACHLPQPVPGWGTAVRYKPLGVVCGDCHDPRGPKGKPGGNRR